MHGHAEAGKLLKLPHDRGHIDLVARAELGAAHVEHVVRLHDLRAYGRVLAQEVVDDVTPHQRDERVHHEMARSRPIQCGARSSFFSTLPDALRGRTSTNSTDVGHL